MQRFSASNAKYSYSPDHASIGTVEAGERFEVESVEGFSGYFRSPSDFTPEVYAEAEAHTAYGVCGVKVWVFKGEILGHDPLAQDRLMMEAQTSGVRPAREERGNR